MHKRGGSPKKRGAAFEQNHRKPVGPESQSVAITSWLIGVNSLSRDAMYSSRFATSIKVSVDKLFSTNYSAIISLGLLFKRLKSEWATWEQVVTDFCPFPLSFFIPAPVIANSQTKTVK